MVKSLMFVAALLASSAYADSIDVVSCSNNGVSVEIFYFPGHPGLSAQVVENAGSRDAIYSNYSVKKQTPGRPGQPMVFKGAGFELNVITDARPVAGQHPSRLQATTENGRVLSEELLCTLY